MNIRRKNRLWIACAVLAGLALTIGLVLYALRSNIDLFYTPGDAGSRAASARRRDGDAG